MVEINSTNKPGVHRTNWSGTNLLNWSEMIFELRW